MSPGFMELFLLLWNATATNRCKSEARASGAAGRRCVTTPHCKARPNHGGDAGRRGEARACAPHPRRRPNARDRRRRQYRVDSGAQHAIGPTALPGLCLPFSVVVVQQLSLSVMEGQNQDLVAGGSPAEVPNDPGKMFIGGLSWQTSPGMARKRVLKLMRKQGMGNKNIIYSLL
ncbi:uncharacterized protein LOC143190836 [Rhynchophorus ferrugineus]|uniref:uncharacterized protein LOC143190836 n=1 Tax=Rhynchophorus ferrugineus TaxID=354439 RepID=UPI003FCC8832